MTNVIRFPKETYGPLDAPEMLRNIADEAPKDAFVICWPEDGKMPTYHCSTGDMPVVLMQLQRFIHKYYNGDFDA